MRSTRQSQQWLDTHRKHRRFQDLPPSTIANHRQRPRSGPQPFPLRYRADQFHTPGTLARAAALGCEAEHQRVTHRQVFQFQAGTACVLHPYQSCRLNRVFRQILLTDPLLHTMIDQYHRIFNINKMNISIFSKRGRFLLEKSFL